MSKRNAQMGMYHSWVVRGLQKDGKTGAGLAKALGVKPPQVSKIISGQRFIDAYELATISIYLDEPVPIPSGVRVEIVAAKSRA